MFYFCLVIEVLMFVTEKVKPGNRVAQSNLSNKNPARGAIEVAGAVSKACCFVRGLLFCMPEMKPGDVFYLAG
jgi:hypothetical protein